MLSIGMYGETNACWIWLIGVNIVKNIDKSTNWKHIKNEHRIQWLWKSNSTTQKGVFIEFIYQLNELE